MIPRVNYANLAKADYTVSCKYITRSKIKWDILKLKKFS